MFSKDTFNKVRDDEPRFYSTRKKDKEKNTEKVIAGYKARNTVLNDLLTRRIKTV